ncbi:MAG TPA: dihydroneopterin aldolase [Actinomycetota bacterium]|nr:dihydroneopterin aldolase [Actinomycetota bacterium]
MSDVVRIHDLRVDTRIGWTDAERDEPRPVVVHIDLHVDTRRAGSSDDLADTVDYHRLTVEVADLVRGAEVRLLERLAEDIADRCLTHPAVNYVVVEVQKPDPPIDEKVDLVSVRIRRP